MFNYMYMYIYYMRKVFTLDQGKLCQLKKTFAPASNKFPPKLTYTLKLL